jgi:hypothetical protein
MDKECGGQRMSWVSFGLRWSIECGGLHTLLNQKTEIKGGYCFGAMQCCPPTSNQQTPSVQHQQKSLFH